MSTPRRPHPGGPFNPPPSDEDVRTGLLGIAAALGFLAVVLPLAIVLWRAAL